MHMDSIEINSNSRLRPRKIQKKCLLTLYVAGELIHERLFVNEPWWMSFSGKKALMNIFSWISLVLKGVDFHRIYVNVKNRYSKNQWIYLSVCPFVAGSLTCKKKSEFRCKKLTFHLAFWYQPSIIHSFIASWWRWKEDSVCARCTTSAG